MTYVICPFSTLESSSVKWDRPSCLTALQGGLLKDNALKTPAGLGHGPQADAEFTRAWSASPGAVWLLAGTSLQGPIDLLWTLWELRTLKTGFLHCFCSLVKPSWGKGWGGWMEEIPRKFFPGEGLTRLPWLITPGLRTKQNGTATLGERKQLCKYDSRSPGDLGAPHRVQIGTSYGLFGQRNVSLAISIISKEKKLYPSTEKKMG